MTAYTRHPLAAFASVRLVLCFCMLSAARASAQETPANGQPTQIQERDIPEGEEQPDKNGLALDAEEAEDPLVTDRPDFTESTVVVRPGRFQIEAGYTYTYDSGDGVRFQEHTYPEFLLRAGIVENVELRLGWTGWTHTEEIFREINRAGRRVKARDRNDGGNDVIVGFKFHLLDQQDLVPDFGVIVEAGLPTGAGSVTSGDVDPAIKFLWAYDLSEEFSVAGNVDFATPTSEAGRYFETSASLSFAYSITDRVGSYVEYFGFYPSDRNQADTHFLNGGFTYLINDDLQLDIRAGLGLNDEADDLFTGIGIVWRY